MKRVSMLCGAVVVLLACEPGPDVTVKDDCQSSQQQLAVLAENLRAVNIGDTGPPLQTLNQWLITWDNAWQSMRAMADLSASDKVVQQANECLSRLNRLYVDLFADEDVAAQIAGVDISQTDTSTQHFVNKIGQQFIVHGRGQTDPQKKSIHAAQLGLRNSSPSTDPQTYRQRVRQLGEALGFPDPIALLLNNLTLVSEQQLRQLLSRSVDRDDQVQEGVSSNALTISIEWPTLRQNLFGLIQKLWGMEFIREDLPQPLPGINGESYVVMENGQRVGQLFLDLQVDNSATAGFNYHPLRRGIVDEQTPIFFISANLPSASLNHHQLRQLLHQFGHFIHHQLARESEWFLLAGLSTEADFVEVPAYWFEQWAWHPQALQLMLGKTLSETDIDLLAIAQQRNNREWRQNLQNIVVQHLDFYSGRHEEINLSPEQIQWLQDHPHCLQQSPLVGCWLNVSLTRLLIEPFHRFGMTDPVSAKNIRDKLLAPGAKRPALDMVADYLGRSVVVEDLYE